MPVEFLTETQKAQYPYPDTLGGFMAGQRVGYVRGSAFDQNPERQLEGIALAKQRGVYRGRKRMLSDDDIVLLKARAESGEKKAQLARDFSMSRETAYQYLRLEA